MEKSKSGIHGPRLPSMIFFRNGWPVDFWLKQLFDIYCHFSKDLSNSTRSICRVAIQSHEKFDFCDLENMQTCFDVSEENYSDDSDFSMSSATGYARSESREVN